jgi:Fe-S-cluster containining protein
MPTLCLALHAGYACRHTGKCCRTWTVPADPHLMELAASGVLGHAPDAAPLFVRADAIDAAAAWSIARDTRGRCVFYDRDGGGLCAVHATAGPAALPSACRHFPRIVLRDGRGTLMSLSHFCPTAAALLFEPATAATVEAGDRLRLDEPIEGLDARQAWPPLVRPGLLSDLEGYDTWERACIGVFARTDRGWEHALDVVAAATEQTRAWNPGDGTLSAFVERAFGSARHEDGTDPDAHSRAMNTLRAVAGPPASDDLADIDGFPAYWSQLVDAGPDGWDVAMRNYLSARVFGNWIAYQGRGLRSIVEWLRTCAAAVRHEAVRRTIARGSLATRHDWLESFRAADLLLLHGIDTAAFARQVRALEGADPR